MFASCSVLVIGFSSLARVIARAILLEYLSSPYSEITRAISPSLAIESHSAALNPYSGFIRISRGPSFKKLKPLAGLSICGDETPRSNNTPATFPEYCFCSTNSRIFAKEVCTISNRASPEKFLFAT